MSERPDDDTVLVVRWLDLLASDEPVTLDEFCASVPAADRDRVRAACAAAANALDVLGPLSSTPRQDLRGVTLGEFTILDEIGRGGMGVVYRARQSSLDRTVAVKVLTIDGDDSVRRLERFRTEALATARIDDPRIVKVFSVGEERGVHFIAMEFVEGHSLHEEFARQRGESRPGASTLPAPTDRDACRAIAGFFAEVAEALQAAHDTGVLHRDVQPKNLLVDAHGRPRIIDFGLARVLDQPSLTRTGEVAGTPFYMSPEQVRAQRDQLDHRTDVYSLGAVLYEALTHTRPFDGDTSQQVMERIVRDEPIRAHRRNRAVPADLAVVCGKALEKRRERRFTDAGEFAADLRRIAHGQPIVSTAPGPARRAARVIERHPLGFSIPLVAAVAIVLGVLVATPRTPSVELVVSRSEHVGVEVLVQAIEPVEWEPVSVRTLGRAPLMARIPLGYYRVWLVRGDTFAEVQIVAIDADARIEIGPVRLASVDGVRDGMIAVPAGTFRFGTDAQDFPGRHPCDASVPGYLIDATEVSNAEFREFVRQSGAEPPSVWPEDWATSWDAAWDPLPVPGVSQEQAVAFAKWAGKRLPTEKEWERAAGGAEGWLLPWRADYDREDVVGRAVVARGDRPKVVSWTPRWECYLANIAPARSHPDARSELGLYHTVGNLTEWTETHMTTALDGVIRTIPHVFVNRGAAWDDGSDDRLIVRHVKFSPSDTNLEFFGFRCAKSLAPPSPPR